MHQFTTDNQVSIEFDPYGLSVKDFCKRKMIAKCNSNGRLYPLWLPAPSPSHALLVGVMPSTLWDR
jgi:hypothetical protein